MICCQDQDDRRQAMRHRHLLGRDTFGSFDHGCEGWLSAEHDTLGILEQLVLNLLRDVITAWVSRSLVR